MTMYDYHGSYLFSSQEIDQLCTLVKLWARGEHYRPIDARKYTQQVRRWARASYLLGEQSGRLYVSTYQDRYQFNLRALPPVVIWRLIEPMLGGEDSVGYSIVNNKLWFTSFGIAPQNMKGVLPRELQEKIDLLLLLDSYHYVIFQMAGSTWSIYRDERNKEVRREQEYPLL